MTVAVHNGLGQHRWALQPDNATQAVKYSWIAQAFSIFTFAFSKISVALFLLLRVVGAARSFWHKAFLYFMSISLLLVNIVVVTLVFTQCRPVQKLFDPSHEGHCWDSHITTAYAQFGGAWSAMTDLGLSLFAVWVVWSLQMKKKYKIRICCLLSLGVFAAVCAIIKTYYLHEHNHLDDATYGQTNLLVWTVLEQWVIIICANIPCVQPIIVAMFHKVKSTYSKDKSTHYSLDDMSVRGGRSLDGSTNAILSNRNRNFE
ncbi:hypothetical protein ACLMJK_008294 [Lecanora helva]